MKLRVGVLLSGCGFLDGSEIQESVFTLLCLDELGVEAVFLAPRGNQRHVVDHAAQAPVGGECRDVLRESARIARGRVRDLATVQAADVDALIVPGGYGVAKNLSDFALQGADGTPHPEVAGLLREVHAAGKPIGAICIAPALVALALGATAHPTLTVGDDRGVAQAIERLGAKHQDCPVDQCVVDRVRRIVTAPAYMYDARPKDVCAGIRKLCAEVVAMCGAGGGR
ncbi:MAG: isoprenoid biosynthesis glyoxalase ElbB [Planctomycetes bacterium]|nr:isoprenoid biosynthesis glyoxalase ElbB [Planctomycetota bacterium]